MLAGEPAPDRRLDHTFAGRGRGDEEHVVQLGVAAPLEVVDVLVRLHTQPMGRLRCVSPIPKRMMRDQQ